MSTPSTSMASNVTPSTAASSRAVPTASDTSRRDDERTMSDVMMSVRSAASRDAACLSFAYTNITAQKNSGGAVSAAGAHLPSALSIPRQFGHIAKTSPQTLQQLLVEGRSTRREGVEIPGPLLPHVDQPGLAQIRQ